MSATEQARLRGVIRALQSLAQYTPRQDDKHMLAAVIEELRDMAADD